MTKKTAVSEALDQLDHTPPSEEKWHRYNLSFLAESTKFACTILSSTKKYVTPSGISAAKTQLSIGEESVLLACSYLGHTTDEEFSDPAYSYDKEFRSED